MFLVDGNVLSEPTKASPVRQVVIWLRENESNLAVNPVILGELEFGILRLPAGRRRTQLMKWFSRGPTYLPVFPLDRATGPVWANLLVQLESRGRSMPATDSLIAATAIQHDLTIATRNTRDYRFAGVDLVNPFEA
jgi:toxin FitB